MNNLTDYTIGTIYFEQYLLNSRYDIQDIYEYLNFIGCIEKDNKINFELLGKIVQEFFEVVHTTDGNIDLMPIRIESA